MEKNKENKKKPLKLSSTGRLQIRKNLGPAGDKPRDQGNKKTIQIVFRNKNNQQKQSSAAQSNFRGSSSFRSQPNFSNSKFNPVPKFNNKSNKSIDNKNKKNQELKKTHQKKSTLKPLDDDGGKIDPKKILEQEEREYDKFPSLAKLKRAREKEKLKAQEKESETKISREIFVPEIITVQEFF